MIHGKHDHEETRATFSHARLSGPSIIIRDFSQAQQLADFIVKNGSRVIALHGALGAGKTTLVRELLRAYGVDSTVITSPTFTYVNQYALKKENKKNELVYHFDLYRLGAPGEFFELGFEEYLADERGICFIEWPEVIRSLLVDRADVCWVTITYSEGKNG